MKRFQTLSALLLVVLAAAGFTGCATPSDPAAMTPTIAAGILHGSTGSVDVKVSGGAETSAAGFSQISDADFSTAIREAISQSKIFASVRDEGDYVLEAYIARLQQPSFGFSMTVTIEVSWTLTRRSDAFVVWRNSIESTHTAGAGEAFAGAKRVRLANEGAAKANIETALRQIAAMNVP